MLAGILVEKSIELADAILFNTTHSSHDTMSISYITYRRLELCVRNCLPFLLV